MLKPNGVTKSADSAFVEVHAAAPRLLVLFDRGQEEIVRVIADALGLNSVIAEGPLEVGALSSDPAAAVIGLESGAILSNDGGRMGGNGRIVINTHAIDCHGLWHDQFTDFYDYEFLYTERELARRDVVRFLGFVLGQVRPHEDLVARPRTAILSIASGDVRDVIPNMDIVTVGADAVELRVDLLKEHLSDTGFDRLPSLMKVGEQLMLLRRATHLPIVFTIRSTSENGRLQVHDPSLIHGYLRKAIQWGVEYIDVELSLPESIRRMLAQEKRNSKIISTFSDFSGEFCWSSEEAYQLYKDGAECGDIVKMVALTDSPEEDYELESFRSVVQAQHPHVPFCGLSMSGTSQLSFTLNQVLTPVTHPMMSSGYSKTGMTIAEIHTKLHSTEELKTVEMYAIGNQAPANGAAQFLQKYLNEISIPHHIRSVERLPAKPLESLIPKHVNFGGAYLDPPTATSGLRLSNLTDAAAQIGQVDTLLPRPASVTTSSAITGDNTTWKSICTTLTQDFVPSAFHNKPALIVGDQSCIHTCYAAIFALQNLHIGPIFSIGFKAKGPLAGNVRYLSDIAALKLAGQPFVIVSALPAHRAMGVAPLLRFYAGAGQSGDGEVQKKGRVLLDLSSAVREKTQALSMAMQSGWMAYGAEDVAAWRVVEYLRSSVKRTVGVELAKRWI